MKLTARTIATMSACLLEGKLKNSIRSFHQPRYSKAPPKFYIGPLDSFLIVAILTTLRTHRKAQSNLVSLMNADLEPPRKQV